MICAANWKLHKTPEESRQFLSEFLEKISDETQKDYIIFPPAVNLMVLSEKLKGTQVGWGAQNIYSEVSGAFTGETSAATIKEMGATHVLVGHSERRQIFGESDDLLARKVTTAQECGLVPMLCVGETLEERAAGRTDEVIGRQLKSGLAGSDFSKPFAIAYEPIWAIGTGKVATPEMAETAHLNLRTSLSELAGEAISRSTPLLYGGSVKPENASDLAKQPNVDGFLIGGASLNVDSFIKIHQNSQ